MQAVQDADAERMLGAGILDYDGAVTFGQERADLEIDVFLAQFGCIEFGTLVEIDLEGVRRGEILGLLGGEEDLLGAAGQLLAVHPHTVGFVFAA